MRPIEPISFIGLAVPAALLFQAGTKDELIPQEDARRYQQAASQPKEVRLVCGRPRVQLHRP